MALKLALMCFGLLAVVSQCEGEGNPASSLLDILNASHGVTTKCKFDQAAMVAMAGRCMASNPGLLMQIMEHGKDLKTSAEQVDFACRNKDGLAKVFDCVEKEVMKCLPNDVVNSIKKIVPGLKELTEGMTFMCDHKEVLENTCLDSKMQEILNCYMGKLTKLHSKFGDVTANPALDIQQVLCSVITAEESCISQHRGTCSQEYIDITFEMIDKIFPTSCQPSLPNIKTKGNVFDSILIHGQPQYGKSKYGQPLKVSKEGAFQYN